jgi:outer membrane immunogenic protein
MLKRSAIAGAAGALMLFAAGAAPASAQSACAPGCDGPANWTGFWLGAGIGANANMVEQTSKDYNLSVNDPNAQLQWASSMDERGAEGFMGSVGLGYDWQIRDRWVLGFFTDFDFGKVENSFTGSGNTDSTVYDFEQNWSWNIGLRLGLVTTNTSMLYGLIGYSRTQLDFSYNFTNTTNGSFNYSEEVDYNGLILGVGLEHDLGNGFSIKGEYRYINYGEENFLDGTRQTDFSPTFEVDDFDPDTHAVRLTLAYKFHRDEVEEVSYKDIAPAPAPYK